MEMRKVLLVVEDYQDLVGIENILRRVGFDVLSVGKDILVADAILGFVPEIVIATLRGRLVDAAKVSFRLAKLYPSPKLAVLTTVENVGNLTAEQREFIDGIIAVPVNPVSLIRTVAQLGGLDSAPLVEKFQKLNSSKPTESKIAVRDGGGEAPKGAEASQFLRGKMTEESGTIEVRGSVGGSTETAQKSDEQKNDSAPNDQWDPVRDKGQAATMRTGRSDRYDAFLAELDEKTAQGMVAKDKLASAIKKLKRDSGKEADSLKAIDSQKREFVKVLYEDDSSQALEAADGPDNSRPDNQKKKA
jgi:hypothetical protein